MLSNFIINRLNMKAIKLMIKIIYWGIWFVMWTVMNLWIFGYIRIELIQ